jgi:hypothetical protein
VYLADTRQLVNPARYCVSAQMIGVITSSTPDVRLNLSSDGLHLPTMDQFPHGASRFSGRPAYTVE